MFRRKEEGAPDYNATTAAGAAQAANGSASSSETQAGASAAQSTTSYTPVSPVVRPLSDVTRSSSSASYRSSPVAEFNRSAAKNQDSGRAASSSHAAAEKHNTTSVKSNPRILTVGNDILLKGEIATCDRVVIEGRVEAKLNDVHTVEIASTGSFKGTAEVEDAEVSGLFEGDLAVRNRLVIYASGEVRGNVTYGEIEIARGGRLTGQIKTVSASSAEKPNLLDVLDKKARSKEAAEA